MDKQDFEARFKRLYPNCELYCVHLNGFSHSVFYKDKDGNKHIGVMSNYASSCEVREEEQYDDGVYRAYSTDRLKALFLGYPNYAYQCNAKEVVFKPVARW